MLHLKTKTVQETGNTHDIRHANTERNNCHEEKICKNFTSFIHLLNTHFIQLKTIAIKQKHF